MYRNRIQVQELTITKDEEENEIEEWNDFYSPRAEVITNMGSPLWEAQAKGYERTVTVYLRFCGKAAEICPVKYRFVFNGNIYDILSADNVNEENKQIRLKGGLKL